MLMLMLEVRVQLNQFIYIARHLGNWSDALDVVFSFPILTTVPDSDWDICTT